MVIVTHGFAFCLGIVVGGMISTVIWLSQPDPRAQIVNQEGKTDRLIVLPEQVR